MVKMKKISWKKLVKSRKVCVMLGAKLVFLVENKVRRQQEPKASSFWLLLVNHMSDTNTNTHLHTHTQIQT